MFFLISIFDSLVYGAHTGTQRAPHVYLSCTYVRVLLSMRRRPPWLSVTCQYFQQFFIPNGIHLLYSDYGSITCKSSKVEDCLFNLTVLGPSFRSLALCTVLFFRDWMEILFSCVIVRNGTIHILALTQFLCRHDYCASMPALLAKFCCV